MNHRLLISATFTPLRRSLVASLCVSGLIAACTTQDPIPGFLPEATTSSSSSGGRSNSSSATGGQAHGGEGGGTGADPWTTSHPSETGDIGGDGDDTGNGDGDGTGDGDATGDGDDPDECGVAPAVTGDFSKQRLLQSVAACSTYQVCLFSRASDELDRKVHEYAEDPSAESLTEARVAWGHAMSAWALAEPNQFGPVAGVVTDQYHGRGLGAFVHAWPSHNRCEIDKQVTTRSYEQGFGSILPTARGLPALEYLLFYEGSDTACSTISATGKAWAQMSADDLALAKQDYAQAAADDLTQRAQELVDVWSEDGEDFGAKLIAHEGYGSQQEALNVVAWSLLYPYHEIRDLQIGPRAGIGDALLNPVSQYALTDIESIRRNLQAFRALFQGCGEGGSGIGFDDWLKDAGAVELAHDILDALQVVENRAAAFPPLHEATVEQATEFYGELKQLSDLLKGQLFGSGSVLNLKLPAGAASDND